MSKAAKTIKRIMGELTLLSLYLITLKAIGWLTTGWLFALAPLLAVAVAKAIALTILLIEYISFRHSHAKKQSDK